MHPGDSVISRNNCSENQLGTANNTHEVAPQAQQATSSSANQLRALASATVAAGAPTASLLSVCVGIDNEAFDVGNELIQRELGDVPVEESCLFSCASVNPGSRSERCTAELNSGSPTHCHVTRGFRPFESAGSSSASSRLRSVRPNYAASPAFSRARPLRIKHGGGKFRSNRCSDRRERPCASPRDHKGVPVVGATALHPGCSTVEQHDSGQFPGGSEVGHSCNTSSVDVYLLDGDILERDLRNQFAGQKVVVAEDSRVTGELGDGGCGDTVGEPLAKPCIHPFDDNSGASIGGNTRVQRRIGVFYSDTDLCGIVSSSSSSRFARGGVRQPPKEVVAGGGEEGLSSSAETYAVSRSHDVPRRDELSALEGEEEGGFLELRAPPAVVRSAHRGGRERGPAEGMARGTTGVDSMGQTRQPSNNEPPIAVPSATEQQQHRERRSSRGRGANDHHHPHGGGGGNARASSRHGNERRTNLTINNNNNNNVQSGGLDGYTNVDVGVVGSPPPDILPDILNSHLPPPYSTLPPPQGGDRGGGGGRRLPPPSHPPPPPPLPHNVPPPLCGAPGTVLPPACPHSTPRRSLRGRAGGFRPFPPRDRLRSSGRGAAFGGGPAASETEEPKHCCGVMVTQTVSIRWFIAMIAFVGLCCAIVGTVLGALKATGREHLTVSLLMIGVGIVLITVSGIAWRLTSHDAPSCRAMLGLQTNAQEPNRRFVPRVPPYGRPHHPYAAMMYPEFQYRPPPPSYQASMQEYRLRLLLLDRQQGNAVTSLSPVSPPPTYRSHTGSTLHSRPPLNLMERDYSRPPSYRSRASSAGVLRPTAAEISPHEQEHHGGAVTSHQVEPVSSSVPQAPGSASHSRNPSLSLSFLSHESLFVDSNHSRPTDSANAATSDNTNPVHFTSPSGESQNSVVAGLSDDSPLTGPDQPIDLAPPVSWARDNPTSLWGLRKHHDVNAVTIVQTTDSSQVLNQDTVIVAISPTSTNAAAAAAAGNVSSRSPAEAPSTVDHGEVQILAHV